MKRLLNRFRKISTKLFVLTSLFLIAFLTLLMIVQSTFFETYYERKKINELKSGLEAFKTSYYDPHGDVDKLMEHAPSFEKEYAAYIGIGQVKEEGFLVIARDSRRLALKVMDKNGNYVEQLTRPLLNNAPDNNTRGMLMAMNEWRGNDALVRRVLDLGEIVAFVGNDSESSGSYNMIAAVAPLPGDKSVDSVLLAVASLQPVGEAAGIVKDFYVYFLLLAVALILLLTYLYSRMISQPLVKLNEVAERMTRLDFTARSDVKSDDEIGSLGRTLNFLSNHLSDTLSQLHTANEQLKADIEKEKRLEQLRREFVASVSHELKTPISLIGGYAEGLKDGIVQGERRSEYLEVIIEEAGRMSSLVMDMLDLSQLEAGKFSLTLSEFSLDELAQATVDKLRVRMEQKRAVFELKLLGANDAVLADRFRIGQVLTNLLDNAIRHVSPGGVIRLGLTHCPGESAVLIEVYNDGEPIPGEHLPHLWDTFYKVEKSRSREYGGSGIGLSIVKSILSMHSGSSYGVRNEDGGVLFYFTLPIAK